MFPTPCFPQCPLVMNSIDGKCQEVNLESVSAGVLLVLLCKCQWVLLDWSVWRLLVDLDWGLWFESSKKSQIEYIA